MRENILFFLWDLTSVIPCVALCYLPFIHNLTRPLRKMIPEVFIACLLSAVLNFIFEQNGLPVGGNISLALLLIPGFFYYRKTVREGVEKLLFVFFVAIHAGSIGGIAELAVFVFTGISAGGAGYYLWTPLFILCRLAIYAAAGWIIHRYFAPRLRQINSRDLKGIWVVPVIFSVLTVYFFTDYHIVAGDYYMPPVLFILLGVMSFSVYIILLRILNNMSENAALREKSRLTERQLTMQHEQYARLMENEETVKALHHDLRHHLMVIGKYADSGDVSGIMDYVGELSAKLPAGEVSYCKNYAVNAVAAHYLGIAGREDISVDARLFMPEATGSVPAIDLCVIMGNLLENAVEACRRMEHGGKFIRIVSDVDGNTLSIVAENSFDGILHEKDGTYLSRKEDAESRGENAPREGVGLASVRAICEKHGGIVRVENAGKIWKVSAIVVME